MTFWKCFMCVTEYAWRGTGETHSLWRSTDLCAIHAFWEQGCFSAYRIFKSTKRKKTRLSNNINVDNIRDWKSRKIYFAITRSCCLNKKHYLRERRSKWWWVQQAFLCTTPEREFITFRSFCLFWMSQWVYRIKRRWMVTRKPLALALKLNLRTGTLSGPL